MTTSAHAKLVPILIGDKGHFPICVSPMSPNLPFGNVESSSYNGQACMIVYWRKHKVFVVCLLALIAVVISSLIVLLAWVYPRTREQLAYSQTAHAIELTNDSAPTWVLPIVSQAAWTATPTPTPITAQPLS